MRARAVADDGVAADTELRHGDRVDGRLGAERQLLGDTALVEREDVFGADAVAAVGDVGEGEVEAARLAFVRLVEPQGDEGVRADLRCLRVHLVRLALARRHDEVRADALDAVGQDHGVLVAGKRGWREQRRRGGGVGGGGGGGCGGGGGGGAWRFGGGEGVAEFGGASRVRREQQAHGGDDVEKRLHCCFARRCLGESIIALAGRDRAELIN